MQELIANLVTKGVDMRGKTLTKPLYPCQTLASEDIRDYSEVYLVDTHIRIIVETPFHKSTTAFKISPGAEIGYLKDEIKIWAVGCGIWPEGLESVDQRLIFKEQELENDEVLESYRIGDGDTIVCTVPKEVLSRPSRSYPQVFAI